MNFGYYNNNMHTYSPELYGHTTNMSLIILLIYVCLDRMKIKIDTLSVVVVVVVVCKAGGL